MKFLEKDLEQIIFEATQEQLEERGLYISDFEFKIKRQLNIGSYGIADLVIFERGRYMDYDEKRMLGNYLVINVIELKKDKIGISAFMQAIRYVKGIKTYLSKRNNKLNVHFKITLIGSSIDLDTDFIYLTDLIYQHDELSMHSTGNLISVDFYTHEYNIDGIKFKKHEGYSLNKNNFNIKNK